MKLTKEQKRAIDKFYKKHYGKKIPYTYHRLFMAYTGVFDEKYIPEMLYAPYLERFLTDPSFGNVFTNKNTAPSNVPAGHIYLQNAGRGKFLDCKPYINGNITTKATNKTYLKYDKTLVTLFFCNFGVLILYKSSCIKPNGHKNPQMVLPKIIE